MLDDLVSVIVPVYKVEKYLYRCVDSILQQTYENLEIILVDDGSPDNCPSICDEYVTKDSRIRVIHKENGGLASARNAGIKMAKGLWIVWVDSDDWIEPDMIEYLIKDVTIQNSDIVVCGYILEYVNSRVLKKLDSGLLNTEEGLIRLLTDNDMGNFMWNKLWKRESFSSIKFPEGRTFEDISVTYKIFAQAERISILPEAKYHYVQRTGNIVSNISLNNMIDCFNSEKDRFDDMKAKWPELTALLARGCLLRVFYTWIAYYYNPQSERKAKADQLIKMSTFVRNHKKYVLGKSFLTFKETIGIFLTCYPRPWSFMIAYLCSRVKNYVFKKKEEKFID